MGSPLASPLAPQGPLVQSSPPRQQAAPQPSQANFQSATQAMKLTPQEQALYQMHLTNLYGPGGVDNPDGSRSTLYQTTVEMDGKNFLIPTVWNGKIVSEEQAVQLAMQYGMDKFPSYGSDQEAESRYQQMHGYMEKDTASYLQSRGK
jgi:hypothetical protein